MRPMKKILILCFFIAISTIAQAQITIQVSDEETKETIELASILLPEHKKRFVTDEHGKFLIDTNKYPHPLNVIVEQFGFESREIALQNVTGIYNDHLNPESEMLHEVINPSKNAKIKESTFGRTNEGFSKIVSTFKDFQKENRNACFEVGLDLNTNYKIKKVKKIHW